MIPDINETMDMIARDLPDYGWLLRTIHDDPRDSQRGQGTHFAHVYKLENGRHVKTFPVAGSSAGSALFTAYNDALNDLGKH